MIVNEAHIQFKVGVDKTDSLNSPNFLVEEVDLYLSDAQEEFIEQRAYGNNFKRESLEETQKRVSDLQSIIENANISTFVTNANNKPNGQFVALPSDYRHAETEEITVSYRDCNNQTITARIQVQALTHDQYNTMVSNPFARPSLNGGYRLPFGRFNSQEHFEIITPVGFTLVTYHLRYLKNPAKIDKAQRLNPLGLPGTATMDLKDECYREIIRIAVRNALGDIESPRTQESIERLKEIE
mgnify:CR=1 FL=1|tara:strand:+ start:58107 stop:58829 length:723 start_codon:yes stop_codon:yes gene_type:complete